MIVKITLEQFSTHLTIIAGMHRLFTGNLGGDLGRDIGVDLKNCSLGWSVIILAEIFMVISENSIYYR